MKRNSQDDEAKALRKNRINTMEGSGRKEDGVITMDNVVEYYNAYDEDSRLERDYLHRIEFLTTIHYLDRLVGPNSRILDMSAGTGKYAFYLAEKGHHVTAGDLVPKHVDRMRARLAERLEDGKTESLSGSMELYCGDARDLSQFDRGSFDVVLCMGPMYHLKEREDRKKVMEESLRVLKSGGLIAVAYLNRLAAFLNEVGKGEDPLDRDFLEEIIKDGYQPGEKSECFYFSSPQEAEKIIADFRVEKLHNIAADGIHYLLRERINNFSEEDFSYWMRHHIRTCEDERLNGYSLHGLYIGRKNP